MRRAMEDIGFTEYSTPILTASSPEGARDFLVPSRIHPGTFFALPQAPQQYKQLLMVAGFDRYFQIAPCFRDEDPRADRLPGEFYQLDLEMSFVTQEEVWETMEPVIGGIFEKFAEGKPVTPIGSFPRIAYDDPPYGSDKPDLRNPLISRTCRTTSPLRALACSKDRRHGRRGPRHSRPEHRREEPQVLRRDERLGAREGYAGLGYVTRKGGEFGGPIAKNHGTEGMEKLYAELGLGADDGLFFAAGKADQAAKLAGAARTRVGNLLGLIDESVRPVLDRRLPLLRGRRGAGQHRFRPQPLLHAAGRDGGADRWRDPLTIKAFQYDLVCNGYEIASGSIRNQHPDLMVKAFEIVGLTKQDVEERGGIYRAFQYGAPPHGGMAAGVDRIVMLRRAEPARNHAVPDEPARRRPADERPCPASLKQLRELHIRVVEQPKG
jgi:aspartyl-tRNA synthetase